MCSRDPSLITTLVNYILSTYYVLGAVGGPGEKAVNRQTSRVKMINICISDMSGDAKNNKQAAGDRE